MGRFCQSGAWARRLATMVTRSHDRPMPDVSIELLPDPPAAEVVAAISAADEVGLHTAFLTDEGSRHYNVRIGEILMGRYRVTQISANAVEVEDTENNRRQMLPIMK